MMIDDSYLDDEGIKSLITNNLLADDGDLKYGGGIVFYPNNRGARFSEGTINLAYVVKDGWICTVEMRSPSDCFRIRKRVVILCRVRYREGKVTEDKITVRKFIQ